MNRFTFGPRKLATAIAGVLAAATLAGTSQTASAGTYVSGDFHNHSTCSDGSISMQKLVAKSTGSGPANFGLDWFAQAGHGGSGNRNCTLEPTGRTQGLGEWHRARAADVALAVAAGTPVSGDGIPHRAG